MGRIFWQCLESPFIHQRGNHQLSPSITHQRITGWPSNLAWDIESDSSALQSKSSRLRCHPSRSLQGRGYSPDWKAPRTVLVDVAARDNPAGFQGCFHNPPIQTQTKPTALWQPSGYFLALNCRKDTRQNPTESPHYTPWSWFPARRPMWIPEKRCTIDMVFATKQLQEKCQEQNSDLFSVYIDLTKFFFDTVSREGL